MQAIGHQLAVSAIIWKTDSCSKCETVNIESVECSTVRDNTCSGILSIMIVHYACNLIICCLIISVLSHSFSALSVCVSVLHFLRVGNTKLRLTLENNHSHRDCLIWIDLGTHPSSATLYVSLIDYIMAGWVVLTRFYPSCLILWTFLYKLAAPCALAGTFWVNSFTQVSLLFLFSTVCSPSLFYFSSLNNHNPTLCLWGGKKNNSQDLLCGCLSFCFQRKGAFF